MVVIYWFYIWTMKCIISTEGSANMCTSAALLRPLVRMCTVFLIHEIPAIWRHMPTQIPQNRSRLSIEIFPHPLQILWWESYVISFLLQVQIFLWLNCFPILDFVNYFTETPDVSMFFLQLYLSWVIKQNLIDKRMKEITLNFYLILDAWCSLLTLI